MTLLDRYRLVRSATVQLCQPLSPEDMVVQSMPDASPAKWHLAHTTWFFETFVLAPAGVQPFDTNYQYLFNSYYEAVGPRHPRPKRGLLTRPGVDEVYRYRTHVDKAMAILLGDRGKSGPLAPIIEIGLNHEQQHQELLLTDIKHALAQNPLKPAYASAAEDDSSELKPVSWRGFDAGVYEIGHTGAGFAFDNEGPRHRVFLEPFSIADRPVSCGEFLAFIEDGGYKRADLWLSDGWHACQANGWQAPLYWERNDNCWWEFTLYGPRPVAENAPACHLSLYEADAFARWAGVRLPTEAEWEVACPTRRPDSHDPTRRPDSHETGYSPERVHPGPVRQATFGDVWEWTQSAYSPYPGFKPVAGALGEYNGKFMCNQAVLRGGSCLTPRSHLRSTYRNFFPPEARWQFTGLRLARSP